MAYSISGFLNDFNKSLNKAFNKQFNFADFKKAVKEEKIALVAPYDPKGDFNPKDYEWIPELENVVEKIMAIASNPRSHIKVFKEVKNSEAAVKIDNKDIAETIKVPKYWKMMGNRMLPEYIFSDTFDIDLAIYENRFIIALVDKMMFYLSSVVNELYSKVRFITKNYYEPKVSIEESDILSKMSKTPGSHKKGASLLTTSDEPYVAVLRRVSQCKNTLTHVLSTPFYKTVKKSKALSDSDIHITNMLAGDRTYAPCFNFYRRLLKLLAIKEKEINISKVVYSDYIALSLIEVLEKNSFSFAGKRLTLNNGHIALEEFSGTNGKFDVSISTKKDFIELTFKLLNKNNSFENVENLKYKLVNKIAIELFPTYTLDYTSAKEIVLYFKELILERIRQGYSNAFVATGIDGTQQDDIIIASPYLEKIDANLDNIIKSTLITTEADRYIYSHICPVCGAVIDGEQEDGNCFCSNCDSIYSIISHSGKENVDTVWFKRLKSPDIA